MEALLHLRPHMFLSWEPSLGVVLVLKDISVLQSRKCATHSNTVRLLGDKRGKNSNRKIKAAHTRYKDLSDREVLGYGFKSQLPS